MFGTEKSIVCGALEAASVKTTSELVCFFFKKLLILSLKLPDKTILHGGTLLKESGKQNPYHLLKATLNIYIFLILFSTIPASINSSTEDPGKFNAFCI